MTYLDAAYQVLRQGREPLHYQQITARALAQNLIAPQGLTPVATMASRLYTDTLQEGSRFTRASKGAFGLAEWRPSGPSGIEGQVQRINQATRDQLHKYLREMPPDRFEALIGELLVQMGFDENAVTVTGRSGDGGIDVVGVYRAAGLTEVNAAVQVKRWKANVQVPTVTSLRGSLQVHQLGIIITTSDFSKGARLEAGASNKVRIGLINGRELLGLLIRHKVGVVERTLRVIGLDDEWWSELAGQPEAVSEPLPIADVPVDAPAVNAATEKKGTRVNKPQAFVFLGETYPAKTWRGVLLSLCTVLAQRHADDFASRSAALRGRTRQYIADSRDGKIAPARIPGTDLWVELNHSRDYTLRLLERLLGIFGYTEGDFQLIA